MTVGVGRAAAVTDDDAVAVHPAALVAVTVYVPTTVTEMLAVVSVVLHTYELPPDAVMTAGTPEHVTPFVADGVGLAAMVTVPLAVAVQLPELVAVTV